MDIVLVAAKLAATSKVAPLATVTLPTTDTFCAVLPPLVNWRFPLLTLRFPLMVMLRKLFWLFSWAIPLTLDPDTLIFKSLYINKSVLGIVIFFPVAGDS